MTGLATVPSAFVSAALSYELSGLETGDRVLIHAGAGGVGLAAIQLAQAAGAEVFATASAPKQAYLRSLGVTHIFDSRQTSFGKEILDATNGAGVTVVLNSLTSEGFIDAEPVLPCAGRPVRGTGEARHSQRRGNGRRTAGCRLRHPGTRCPQENRPRMGGTGPQRCRGADRVG